MERDAIRRQHALEKYERQLDKQREIERAAHAVEKYENHIEVLQSVHKDCTPPVDWQGISSSPQPEEAQDTHSSEQSAQLTYDKFRPTLLHKVFKKEEQMRLGLSLKIEKAKEEDQNRNQSKHDEYLVKLTDWRDSVAMAQRILSHDTAAYKEAIEEMNPFKEIATLGSEVALNFPSGNQIEVAIHVHDEKVIPKDQMTLLKSGKLSVKPLPVSRFYEIYQDHVCSVILRIGRELFALLPVEDVVLNATSILLNTATGKMEKSIIVSALFKQETMANLNFESLDPSDSLQNFLHNMDFKKSRGFLAVDPVSLNGA
jgi:hypothetical protein